MKKAIVIGGVSLSVIICLVMSVTALNRTTKEFNKRQNLVLQTNIDVIYENLVNLTNQIEEQENNFSKIMDAFSDSCYASVKTICILESEKYNLSEFQTFLLLLKGRTYYSEDERQIIMDKFNLMKNLFNEISWRTTYGLGKQGYYDFLDKDELQISGVISEIEKMAYSLNDILLEK